MKKKNVKLSVFIIAMMFWFIACSSSDTSYPPYTIIIPLAFDSALVNPTERILIRLSSTSF